MSYLDHHSAESPLDRFPSHTQIGKQWFVTSCSFPAYREWRRLRLVIIQFWCFACPKQSHLTILPKKEYTPITLSHGRNARREKDICRGGPICALEDQQA